MKLRTQILIKGYIEKGKFEDALTVIDENIVEDPENSYLNYYKARTLYSLERYSEAVAPMKKAIYKDKNNNEIALLAADIFTKLKYYSKAEEFYTYTLKLHPENPEASSGYACLLAVLGRIDEAKTYLYKAIEKDSDNQRVIIAKQRIELIEKNQHKQAEILGKIDSRLIGSRYDAVTKGIKKINSFETDDARMIFREVLGNSEEDNELFDTLEEVIKGKEINPIYKYFISLKWQFLFICLNIFPIMVLYKSKKIYELYIYSFLLIIYCFLTVFVNMLYRKKIKKSK